MSAPSDDPLDHVDPFGQPCSIRFFPRANGHIHHHARGIIDGGVLFVGRLQLLARGIGRHAGLGIGDANLLEPAGLARQAILVRQACCLDRIQMARCEPIETDIGPDQRRIDMHDLARRYPGRDATADAAFKDCPEPINAPALPDPR